MFVFAAGFGNDRIVDFHATPSGGQDYLDISAFGITNATFGARVAIADVGADTLVTIDGNAAQTIRLVGIADATTVTQADFLLWVECPPLGGDVCEERSREMIAAWQKARNEPATGFLNAAQQQPILKEAAPALSAYDEEREGRRRT